MKPDWRECPRGDVTGQWAALYVTLNRKGTISMSRITYEKLNEPAAFLLWFDSVNNRLGLKPTGRGMRNAFPVAKQGRHGGRIIRGYRMMQEFGIKLPETIRFRDVEINDDGVLILDMRTAKVCARSRAHRKGHANSAKDASADGHSR